MSGDCTEDQLRRVQVFFHRGGGLCVGPESRRDSRFEVETLALSLS